MKLHWKSWNCKSKSWISQNYRFITILNEFVLQQNYKPISGRWFVCLYICVLINTVFPERFDLETWKLVCRLFSGWTRHRGSVVLFVCTFLSKKIFGITISSGPKYIKFDRLAILTRPRNVLILIGFLLWCS